MLAPQPPSCRLVCYPTERRGLQVVLSVIPELADAASWGRPCNPTVCKASALAWSSWTMQYLIESPARAELCDPGPFENQNAPCCPRQKVVGPRKRQRPNAKDQSPFVDLVQTLAASTSSGLTAASMAPSSLRLKRTTHSNGLLP